MKKHYHAFNHWINKKKIQHTPSKKTVVWILPVILIILVVLDTNNKLTDVLGLSTKTPLTQVENQPLPTIGITDTPTETPSPTIFQEQIQQQKYQPPAQQQYVPAQAPQKINCFVNAYVPDPTPIYAQLTPELCTYEQRYAVMLWNQTVGQNRQPEQQIPIPQYQSPPQTQIQNPQSLFNNGQPPPTMPPLPPAPNGNLNYPINISTPTPCEVEESGVLISVPC